VYRSSKYIGLCALLSSLSIGLLTVKIPLSSPVITIELMDIGIAQAKLKPGTIGVKVAIMKPDAVLPAEITVVKPVEAVVETPEDKEEDTEDNKAEEVVETPEAKEEKSETKDAKKEVSEKKEKPKK
jgi:ribosomal protein S3